METLKRCGTCWKTFDPDKVKVSARDKEEFDWWTEDLSHDHFKDYPETPGICSGKCLHKMLKEIDADF